MNGLPGVYPPGMSPLAEGRELKFFNAHQIPGVVESPLAEGRELKLCRRFRCRPNAAVAPRGGA